MNRLPIVIAGLALLGVVFLFTRLSAMEDELKRSRTQGGAVVQATLEAGAQPIEVMHYMGRMQDLANKLWFAGRAGNLELAEFYRHELKEEMETIANAGLVEDGVPESEHMKTYGIRTVDAMKEEFKTNGLKDFTAQYDMLVNTCNSCHAITGHAYIRIQAPTAPRFDDQVFGPVK